MAKPSRWRSVLGVPIGIWILIISVVCVVLGKLIDELSVLSDIGIVLFGLWVIGAIIAFFMEAG